MLINNVAQHVLSNFTPLEINEMLKEHQETNGIGLQPKQSFLLEDPKAIQSQIYNTRLEIAYTIKKEKLLEAIKTESKIIAEKWIPEIITILKSEGLNFPTKIAKMK